MDSNVLYHHGILGQRWGVRRYQRKDGTLTRAGKKRAAKLRSQYRKVTGRDIEAEKTQGAEVDRNKQLARKPVSEMTNDELNEAINRKKLENTYLSYFPQVEKKKSIGKRAVTAVGKKVLAPVAIEVGKQASKQMAINFINNHSKLQLSNNNDKKKDNKN